jgi:colanic acid biosynthesis glycosyl transferase WcaI
MQILIYSYNYDPEPIGIAPLMTELAEGLVQRGHQVRVVTGMPNYPQRQIYEGYRNRIYLTEERNGVTIQRCYVWIRPKPSFMDRVLLEGSFVVTSAIQALNGWQPDVILLTVPPLSACVPATLLARWNQCPVVLNLQDILPDAAVQTELLRNPALIRIFERLERFAYEHSTKISVIAEGFVENLRAKAVPEDKLELIPNWVDVNFIRPLPRHESHFRAEHGLEGKFVALYSGNIALTQGLETAVYAAKELKDRNFRDIAIVIVGEGRALERLQRLRKRYELEKEVLLLPFQPREKLPDMLSAASVGLVSQKHNVISFNMPSKIPVLLASGRAIVASVPLSGTAARAVKDSEGGIVIPPEDPYALANTFQDLYYNPEKVDGLARQGRQYAIEHYSFDRALNQYEALFQSLVSPAVPTVEVAPESSQ